MGIGGWLVRRIGDPAVLHTDPDQQHEHNHDADQIRHHIDERILPAGFDVFGKWSLHEVAEVARLRKVSMSGFYRPELSRVQLRIYFRVTCNPLSAIRAWISAKRPSPLGPSSRTST